MSQRPPGRPRRADKTLKISTARHILQEARHLFAQRGYSAVSINDIVAAAEVSKPTLYYYYPDKESLYSAVLTEVIEKAGAYFQAALAQPLPLRARLVELTSGFFEHAPTSLPCMLRDVSQHLNEPSSQKVLDLYRAQVYAPFEKIFQGAIHNHELKPLQSPRLLTELFLTMLDWLNLRFSFHEGPPLDAHEKAAQVVDLFLDGAKL